MLDLYRKHNARGLEFVMVSDEPMARLKRYLDVTQVPVPVLCDAKDEAHLNYGVTGVPFTVLVDRQGRVAKVLSGYSLDLFEDQFVPAVEAVLKD